MKVLLRQREMKRNKILKQIEVLESQLKELKRSILFETGRYTIIAGMTKDSAIVGLVDEDGLFIPMQGIVQNDPDFKKLKSADKFRFLSGGIYRAIQQIPVTKLEPYLKDDGPQIKLKLHPLNLFRKKYTKEAKELCDTMKLHFDNYRIDICPLPSEEWQMLME